MGKMKASNPVPPDRAQRFLSVGLVAVFGLLVFTFPVGFIGYGIHDATVQDRLIRAARPVVATVVSSRVGEVRGRRGRRHEVPIIIFRYEVAGWTYHSDRSMVLGARGWPDGMTLRQFVSAHPPGASVQAYYVPNEPWRGFLLKKYDEAPYVAIYCGLGFLVLILYSGVVDRFVPARAAPPDGRWHPLVGRRQLRTRVRMKLLQGVVYLGVWGWTVWHYFARVPPPHEVASHVIAWVMGVPGLWYLAASARARFTGRAVSDARVAVGGRELCVGEEAHLRVEQDLIGGAALERVRVGLVCEKTTGTGKQKLTEVRWQTWVSPIVPARPSDGEPGPGRRVSFTETLYIPADLPASEPVRDPQYTWKVVVETALARCPDYRGEFEVTIRSAEDGDDGKRAPRTKVKKRRRRTPPA